MSARMGVDGLKLSSGMFLEAMLYRVAAFGLQSKSLSDLSLGFLMATVTWVFPICSFLVPLGY